MCCDVFRKGGFISRKIREAAGVPEARVAAGIADIAEGLAKFKDI